jgi:adenosyl cobinamide kinase/adenosyl cobinamide phosphate guanylyltransferase
MKLIIGGAYQGMREYAVLRYPELEVVEDFHLKVFNMIKNGENPQKLLEDCKDKVIICDDIFCGDVPVFQLARRWREELARVLAIAAAESDEVIRVFCGIGTRIK